jgi:ABC-type phosphate transport system substrate-binding protein
MQMKPHSIGKQIAFGAVFLGILLPHYVRADIVVIVNAANKAEIDDSAIARIYLAQVKTFPGGSEATAVEQKDGSAVRNEFSDKLLKRAPAHIKSYWAQQKFTGGAKPLPQLSNDDAVLKYVLETPNAIGYVDTAKLRDGVRVVMRL